MSADRRRGSFGRLAVLAVAPVILGLASSQNAPATLPETVGLCEGYSGIPAGTERHAGMVYIQEGRFTMGSDVHYAEEAWAHEVQVSGFWIDRHDVTNAQFARFVQATGYVTVAERMPDLRRHPDLPEAMRVPGSAVFVMPNPGEGGHWRYVAGANWRHPQGPGSSIAAIPAHPAVHIAYEDAEAYSRWRGRELPTEAQWEYAARGGLEGTTYIWGDQLTTSSGRFSANIWQGVFPLQNTADDGYIGTSPVGCYPANGFGLYDMAGNVWQWTASWYRNRHTGLAEADPPGPTEQESFDPRQPGTPAKVIKGGSHLCAPNYCLRYRPTARQARETDSGTSHIGFRTVLNEGPPKPASSLAR